MHIMYIYEHIFAYIRANQLFLSQGLSHPCVCPVLDASLYMDELFVLLPYVENTLYDVLGQLQRNRVHDLR
jgi:hypothetical protein